jgi:hypothetical protein
VPTKERGTANNFHHDYHYRVLTITCFIIDHVFKKNNKFISLHFAPIFKPFHRSVLVLSEVVSCTLKVPFLNQSDDSRRERQRIQRISCANKNEAQLISLRLLLPCFNHHLFRYVLLITILVVLYSIRIFLHSIFPF